LVPVVPTLTYIERRQLEVSLRKHNDPDAGTSSSGPSTLSGASGSSGEQRVLPNDRADNDGNALDGRDEVTDEDRHDLLEFAALSAWFNIKHSPICQIPPAIAQSLATTSRKDLFGQDAVEMGIDSGDRSRQETAEQAQGNSLDPELAEFAALSHLPPIFGPIDPVPNHLSLPTVDNG
jgi:hypothetical protein